MKNRFYVVTLYIHKTAEHLLSLNFEQLDNLCDSEFDLYVKIFIDRDLRTFYYLDEESCEMAVDIVIKKYKKNCKNIHLNKIISSWT